MITLKKDMTKNQNSYSQTLIVSCMKLSLKMFMKILTAIKKCFTLVIVQLNQTFMMIQKISH